eukprot:gene30625-34768_t
MNTQRPKFDKIAFLSSTSDEAESARAKLTQQYGSCPPAEADVIVALGGDGFMLQTLHSLMNSAKPIYGMHRGTVGFLMNDYQTDGLLERLAVAEVSSIRPLIMRTIARDGSYNE